MKFNKPKVNGASKWRGWANRNKKPLVTVLVAVVLFAGGYVAGSGGVSFSRFSSNSNLPDKLNYSSLNQVYQDLRDDFDGKLSANKLLNGAKVGLTAATGDPHTQYFPPKQAKAFEKQLKGKFSGIGAELGQNNSGELEIIAPIKGTPAAKAGLKPHDVVAGINGKSTSGISLEAAVNKIRGKSGTKVSLTIVRGSKPPFTVKITRANIIVPSVNSKILSGNIGYMQINQFNDGTSELAAGAVEKFQNANVKGVILDLRGNPGGEVEAAINVSSLWLKKGQVIMREKHDSKTVKTYKATGDNPLLGVPTVVLINGGSASAAEITTGALKDNGAAYVIGTRSYGKGSVQEVLDLKNGAELKITIYHWFTPNGKSISKKGIKPDKTIKLTKQNTKHNHDPQLAAAKKYLKK
jgi:carboxyl-terminal processing protease